MKRNLRKLLTLLLALVFLGSSAKTVYQLFQYKEGDEISQEARDLVRLPDLPELPVPEFSASQSQEEPAVEQPVYVDPYADALRDMDFTALRQVNDDVLGWILVPGTNLSYPLVQGSDNSYYLNHSWRKSRNSAGAIFLEQSNHSDLSDFNTIVYGHRMNNRSMFGTLKYYKDQSYWHKHPSIYLTDDRGSHKYEIFAAYEVSVDSDTYRMSFPNDDAKQQFLDFCVSQSVIDTGVTPTVYDRVLTLSTCTGNGHATRWIVQAVLKGTAPPSAPALVEPEPPQEPEVTPEPETPPQEPERPDISEPLPGEEPVTEEEPISQDIPVPAEDASAQP